MRKKVIDSLHRRAYPLDKSPAEFALKRLAGKRLPDFFREVCHGADTYHYSGAAFAGSNSIVATQPRVGLWTKRRAGIDPDNRTDLGADEDHLGVAQTVKARNLVGASGTDFSL